jgi:hypothetical protein
MKRRFRPTGYCLGLIAVWGCLFVSVAAGAQVRMSKEEVAQLYTAAGFPIVNNQPVNRCGKPAKPRVTFVDINADKRPEALFIDGDSSCYGFSGRYFAVVVKEGATWRPLAHGNGSVQALQSRTAGWLDLRITDAGCVRDHRYDGQAYKAATACNETVAAAPQVNPQPAPAAPQSAKTAQSSAAGSPGTQTPPPSSPDKPAAGKLTAADEAAAFKAAGLKKRGSGWHACDDPNNRTGSASIESVGDLNGDGLPEAVITEGGSFCYGNTGQAFWLVSKQSNDSWKLMTNSTGIPEFLKSKGAGGWPDVSIGGPGFCFPVQRWNGTKYVFNRDEYEGKACKR